MSKKDKILSRFLSRPTDFTFDELVTLLGHFGFSLSHHLKKEGYYENGKLHAVQGLLRKYNVF